MASWTCPHHKDKAHILTARWAGVVVQVSETTAGKASSPCVLAQVSTVLLLMELPNNAPGKAAIDGSRAWVPVTHMERPR